MSQNLSDPQTKQIPLTTFSGVVTNINPIALPSGSSPDASDMTFLPGGTFSRPCLGKVFATPFGSVTVTYAKSYVDPTGAIRNLFLDSAGNLWLENLSSAPGVYTLVTTTTPGSYAKSATAFGREYIAISDGLHGQEIPLQLTGLPDGTYQLDRVTQDGPGAPPVVTSLSLPAVQMQGPSAPATLTIVSIYPDQRVGGSTGPFSALNIYVSSGASTATVGLQITVSGTSGSAYVGTYAVITNPGPAGAITVSAYNSGTATPYLSGGTLTIGSGVTHTTMSRSNNVVTVYCAAAHNLQVGFQAQITGMTAAAIGSGISSIVLNNENLAGVAVATTNAAHGLVPQCIVAIAGVQGGSIAVSGSITITSLTRAGGIVTVVMNAATILSPGAIIQIAGVPTASFNTITQVLNVTTTSAAGDTFTYLQSDVDATDTSGTGTILVNWPIPETATPSLFEVLAAPTPTTFQIQLNYSDGAWSTGTVSFAWDSVGGGFIVQSVPALPADGSGNPTSFTYQQIGPNASTTQQGYVVPYGQAAPGIHLFSQAFLTRQGAITEPSPWVQVILNGGQFVSVTQLAIGPPNVVARIILATGAGGAFFFYIPDPPQANGQIVGTATQVDDNTTTSVLLDFSDPTLLNAIGTSIQGNNLANQIVLDSALGFGFYGSRLIPWGQRNTVQNLLNMGFDGGYLPNTLVTTTAGAFVVGQSYTILAVGSTNFVAIGAASNTVGISFIATGVGSGSGTANQSFPAGWNDSLNSGGSLAPGHIALWGWNIAVTPSAPRGELFQSAYEDVTGSPILAANTPFRMRVWLKPSVVAADLTFTVKISSASTSFSSTASVAGSLMKASGSWLEVLFSANTPSSIPGDMILSLYATSTATTLTLLVDELNIIFGDDPYNTGLYGSYVNNPEGIDGVTGDFGPEDDTHQTMDIFILRSDLYMLTQDPSGRLHQTSQGVSEPATWAVNEVASNCGMISALSLTKSQADDSTASGGEEWTAWYSSDGPRVFGGASPDKIAQEIQRPPGQTFPGSPSDLGALNITARLTVWALNDPSQKLMYFGIPTGNETAPNVIWVMSYIGLDSADAIASRAPVHLSLAGKMVTSDLARKWCPWQLSMNGGALMYRSAGVLQTVLFGGNGSNPSEPSGTCNTANSTLGQTSLVTQVSGGSFAGFQVGSPIVINGVSTTVATIPANNHFLGPNQITVRGLLGTQSGVVFSATLYPGFGNVYTLNPNYYTDDDYGAMTPYYKTYGMPARDEEQQLQLGGGQKLLAYTSTVQGGVGIFAISVYYGDLVSLWPLNGTGYVMQEDPFDTEWGGGNAQGNRFFFEFSVSPNPEGSTSKPATDVALAITSFMAALKPPRMRVRGSYP